jgi:hypothetical protein
VTEPGPTPLVVPVGTDPTGPVVVVGAEPVTQVEQVAAAVLALPGVVRLFGGRFGELGTYLPGRRVTGVRIGEAGEGTEVHIVVDGLEPVPLTAGRVQRAVSAIAPMPVHVFVDDIDVPPSTTV